MPLPAGAATGVSVANPATATAIGLAHDALTESSVDSESSSSAQMSAAFWGAFLYIEPT